MRIVCPACDATYDVPDALLGGGTRMVRCAKCGQEWSPMPTSVAPLPPDDADETEAERPAVRAPAEQPATAEQVADSPRTAMEEPPVGGRQEPRLSPLRPRFEPRLEAYPMPEPDPPPRRGGAVAVVAWTLSILILAGAGAAAVAYRSQVMALWPPSERVYAALGLS